MSTLILGLVLFIGVHSVSIVAPAWRNAMAARFGEWSWKALYAMLAIVGFVLIIQGYSAARLDPVVVWVPPAAMRHVAALLMLPVFMLLLSAYLPGRIHAAAKHPMLLATKFWAFAHLLANGMLADIVLFGALLAWAVADRISLKRRVARPIPGAPASKFNDAIAVVGGLALYGIFATMLHARWFGVAPFGG